MRRFACLAILLFFTIPMGLSIAGCGRKTAAVVYCNSSDTGPVVGQVASITLSPTFATTGVSLNYAQIGPLLSATAQDCKGTTVSVKSYTYASTSSFSNSAAGSVFADINPSTGSVCGGTWNRNSGGGIADYTTCSPPSNPSGYLAYVTATADGTVSNAIPVYVHPVVTGVILGLPTGSPGSNTSCGTATSAAVDPGTDCCTYTIPENPSTTNVYNSSSCLSQNQAGRLVARVYQGGNTSPSNNITCQVGHLTYAALNATNVVTIDTEGVATANLPGSAVITATVANSSSASEAGFFSTCPPASIALTVPGQSGSSSIDVSLNNTQPLTASIKDTAGSTITGLSLEFNSTSPQNIPASSTGTVTPAFPGTATITAVCQPSTCNPSPFNQIGIDTPPASGFAPGIPSSANGKSVTSNGISVTATGASGTAIYMGSTGSQYLQPRDFTTTSTGSLIKLPYLPNSMVITQDGSEIYLGSSQGLMSVATATNTQGAVHQTVPGQVLSVSPSGATVVVTDPTRSTISLYATATSAVATSYGGVGTTAAWSPDSNTVYITTTGGNVLTYSSFTGWQSTALTGADSTYKDVAVMVPSIGAYFAGANTEGRSYCPLTTLTNSTANPPIATNVFAPLADEDSAPTDVVAATTDGKHILGATVTTSPAQLNDIALTLPSTATQPNGPGVCTTVPVGSSVAFTSSHTSYPLANITATSITGVQPTSNSALGFVTYAGASGLLPYYAIPSAGTGALNYLTLGNGATAASAPVSGVVSTDNLTFYAGTSGASAGDTTSVNNDVHIISLSGTTPTETGIISPNLPAFTGTGYAPVNMLVQRPKKSTNGGTQ